MVILQNGCGYYFVLIWFFVDLVLTFFTTFLNEDMEYTLEFWPIWRRYLFGWFLLDLISWIPMSLIIQSDSYNSLARFSRLPRIYRVIKVLKLTRMLRIVKEKSKWSKYLNEVLSISIGLERFILFLLFSLIIIHVSAWGWFFIGNFNDDLRESWYFRKGIQDEPDFDVYITCVYFVITSIITVGYGDISGGTTYERIFCIFLMITGVIIFSFTTSAFTTLITNIDSSNAKLKTRMSQLNTLNAKYNINLRLYHKLEKVLKYDHSK